MENRKEKYIPKSGDVVTRKDGAKGKVIKSLFKTASGYDVKYDTKEIEPLDLVDTSNYYQISDVVFGNKCTVEELERRIIEKDEEIQQKKAEKAQLRKQLWRLTEEMVDDWFERKALRERRRQEREQRMHRKKITIGKEQNKIE